MKKLMLVALLCVGASLPPMPRDKTVLKSPKDASTFVGKVSTPAVVITPRLMNVTLTYNVAPITNAVTWVTGIASSTNLVNWSDAWTAPYPTSSVTVYVVVRLTNQPPMCFYRAFNRL